LLHGPVREHVVGPGGGRAGRKLDRGRSQHLPPAGRPRGDHGDHVGRQAPGVRQPGPADRRQPRQARDVPRAAELTVGNTPGARPSAGRFVFVAAAAVFAVLIAAYAWLWTPWRYFPANEVARVAYPMRDVGLQFPAGREGVDYYGTLR